jgi:hypothetical protein
MNAHLSETIKNDDIPRGNHAARVHHATFRSGEPLAVVS